MRTATRTALGTSSCSSASRLATTSVVKKLMPVALPPGRARLATRPNSTGSSHAEDNRNCRCRRFGHDRNIRITERGNHGHTTTNQVINKRRQTIELALKPMVFDRHVLALHIAGFTKALAEPSQTVR